MKKVLAALAITAAIGGCTDEFADAKLRAASAMKDPSSVQFRNLHRGVEAGTVCGEINAKNGFGGYSGFERFFIREGAAYPFVPSVAGAMSTSSDMNESQRTTMERNIQLEIDKACDIGKANAINAEAARMAAAAAERERAAREKK